MLDAGQVLFDVGPLKVRVEDIDTMVESFGLHSQAIGQVAHPVNKHLAAFDVEGVRVIKTAETLALGQTLEDHVHGNFTLVVLVGLANGLGRLYREVPAVFVAHLFNHPQGSQVLEVSTCLTVAKVVIKRVRDETLGMRLIAGDTPENKVDFQLVFSRHF